jgi:hypothetical protein
MNAKLGEYCGLVHGDTLESTPDGPVDGGTDGLMGAVALYRGIQRPMIDPGLDSDIYVYVTKRLTGAGPIRIARPKDSVFVTYAEIGARASNQLDEWSKSGAKCAGLDGIIHNWEWVLWAPLDPHLPDRHEARYQDRIW